MEIYDTANQLASEIRKSTQFVNLKKAKEKVEANPENKAKLEEFERLKQESQLLDLKKQSNQPIDEEELETKKRELIQKYSELIENEDTKAYLECELHFNEIMVDINKILGNVVKEIL